MKINEDVKVFNGRSWILQRRENDINNSNFRLQKESSERYEKKEIGYEIYNPISFQER